MATYWTILKRFGVFCFVLYFALSTNALAQTVNYVPAPTGTPEIDWQNIQNGLDGMGPGETLQLAQGTYKIHRPLSFVDWNGSLIGAGPGATIIEVSKASNGDLFAVIHAPQWDDFDFPGAQTFETPVFQVHNAQGLFRISNLTVKVTEIGVAERSYVLDTNRGRGRIAFFIDVWENNNSHLINGALGAEVDVVIENCSFIGSAAGQFFGQPNHGIQLNGDLFGTVGDYTVRDCNFDGIGTNVVNPIAMHESKIVIEDNTFSDSARPVVLWNNSGCTIDVLNNEASNVLHATVFAVLGPPELPSPARPCHVTVSGLEVHGGGGVFWDQFGNDSLFDVGVLTHNTIRQKPNSSWAGFELWDNGNSTLIVSHNNIHGEDTFTWGPIFAFDVHDAVISNNKITGSGPAAAYLGAFPGSSVTGLTLLGNNFENWITKPFFDIDGIAPIWLGTWTQGNTVIGGDNGTNVLDEGVDNTITGVNNMGTNIGQDIRDAMFQKIEAKRVQMELEAAFR
jgi:hypothetical protein